MGNGNGPLPEVFDGRFAGTFDVDEAVGRTQEYGDAVSFLITTRINKSTLSTTKDGLVKRSDTYQVHDVVPLSAEAYQQLLNGLVIAPTPAEEALPDEAGWIPDDEDVVRVVKLSGEEVEDDWMADVLEDVRAELHEERVNHGMLVDDELDQTILADEDDDEVFSPGGGDVQRIPIPGAFDPLAMEEEVEKSEPAATLDPFAREPVKRVDGKDKELENFLMEA